MHIDLTLKITLTEQERTIIQRVAQHLEYEFNGAGIAIFLQSETANIDLNLARMLRAALQNSCGLNDVIQERLFRRFCHFVEVLDLREDWEKADKDPEPRSKAEIREQVLRTVQNARASRECVSTVVDDELDF